MKKSSPIYQAQLKERSDALRTVISNGGTVEPGMWVYLQDSEQQLIDLMTGTPPGPTAAGNIEFCWCLYFLNNDIPSDLTVILQDVFQMPGSSITSANWQTWETELSGNGELLGDGSLVSTAPYAVLDAGWGLVFLTYLIYFFDPSAIHAFNSTPATVTIPSSQTSLNVALFGDWGTGAYTDGNLASSPSQQISTEIASQTPDVCIHLGDVYYAGIEEEETANLVNCWPNGSTGGTLGNFTMNSNHEMYDGANGLFKVSLNSSIFTDQSQSTFFSIAFGDWLIIGLDSAYNATGLYMVGRVIDPAQLEFLQNAGASGKKIFIMTHHNAISEIGDAKETLWNDVVSALGKNPDYWYWGHVHNGIVYSPSSAGSGILCRCLGNAAIPIGNASWFESNTNIEFFTSTSLNSVYPGNDPLRVLNGYAILTFTEDTVVEHWYNQDGSLAWSLHS